MDALRNEYILDFGKPTSTDFKITIDKLVAECQKLLASSCLIKNNKTRQRFFTTLKKLATDLMTLSTVKDKVHQVVERVRDGDRMNRRRTGFVKELPRWNQFLNKNAPGTNALLLQLRRMLHPKRDAYQVIPRGGIKILQHWDERLHSLTLTIDTVRHSHHSPHLRTSQLTHSQLRPSKISLWHKVRALLRHSLLSASGPPPDAPAPARHGQGQREAMMGQEQRDTKTAANTPHSASNGATPACTGSTWACAPLSP